MKQAISWPVSKDQTCGHVPKTGPATVGRPSRGPHTIYSTPTKADRVPLGPTRPCSRAHYKCQGQRRHSRDAFLAGTNKMNWAHFFVANAAGGILWSAIYTFAAYITSSALQPSVGDDQPGPGRRGHSGDRDGVPACEARTNRLIALAEEAYPGPFSD